ncbi:MAG: ESS family glutamate:Na+ symporter [Thermoproteota archaeon]|jgi:ESS family glutamate:Na+ symporter
MIDSVSGFLSAFFPDLIAVLLCMIFAFYIYRLLKYLFHILLKTDFPLPYFIIAGFTGLAIGQQGLSFIEFSSMFKSYPSFLIAMIFSLLPFFISSNRGNKEKRIKVSQKSDTVKRLWLYSSLHLYFHWMVGIIVYYLFSSELPIGFASILPVGFIGGHGTAIAVGEYFSHLPGDLAWNEASDLCLTAATIGFITSITGGLIWLKKAKTSKQETISANFNPKVQRPALISFFQVLLFSLTLCFLTSLLPSYIPWFIYTYFCSVLIKFTLGKISSSFYQRRQATFYFINHYLTEVLITVGIISININLVIKYKTPLFTLFSLGIIGSVILFKFISIRILKDHQFRLALITWGWTTGVIATALALNNCLDGDKKQGILDEFTVFYLLFSPIEILMIFLGPYLLVKGEIYYLGLICSIAFVVTLFLGLNLKNQNQVQE